MASRSRKSTTTDLGIVEGWFGENLVQSQLAATHIDVALTGPVLQDGAWFVVLELAISLPGAPDKEVELELPVHTARQLRDALDDVLEDVDES
jgi:hypothetical protein